MNVFTPDIAWPVLGALAAGSAIGFEREFRARAAGFRTHALVALASCLLMLAATRAPGMTPAEPGRIAPGVLTGLGFLCGGVIFRSGLTVHGLTTAASLWITAALGLLFGLGVMELGWAGTVLTLLILTVFRLVDIYTPSRWDAEILVRFRREDAPTEEEFTRLLGGLRYRSSRVVQRLTSGGAVMEFSTSVASVRTKGSEALAKHLCGDKRVIEFSIEPRDG